MKEKIPSNSLEKLHKKDDFDKKILFYQEKNGYNALLKFREKFQNGLELKIKNSFNFFSLSKNRMKKIRIINNSFINTNFFFIKTIINFFIMINAILLISSR